jgi:glycerol-3-phosphate cytidylyltransferase
MSRIIGYSTGTFDILHQGHLYALEFMRSRCDTLIIGLTTDELAIKQKRKTICSYDQRKSLVDKFATIVQPNHGLTKQEDYKLLQFDILFIGQEYKNANEYISFQKDYPNIPVIFYPRIPNISTSNIIGKFPEILSIGLYGPIFHQHGIVTKLIHVGYSEVGSTADVYNMPIPRLRNFKKVGEEHVHPNIPGVNSNREINIFPIIKHEIWNSIVNTTLAFENKNAPHGDIITEHNFPKQIFYINQKFVGITFLKWMKGKTVQQINYMCEKVKLICQDLIKLEIVHGDVHLENICVFNDKLFLIDFGWCQHSSFEMNQEETKQFKYRLENEWDFTHFMDSLQWYKVKMIQ